MRLLEALGRSDSGYPHPPQACLVNFYDTDARMGLHQDRDENDSPLRSCRSRSAMPVCSVSVEPNDGNRPCRSSWKAATWSWYWEGSRRLAFHGVDRIYPTTSTLLRDGGRINLTLRRVTGS
jgi:alkylated DNA repair protein (DNA oxidative demethylase)